MSSDLANMWKNAGGSVPDDWPFVKFEELLESPKAISVGVMYPGTHVENGTPLIKVSDVKNGYIVGIPEFKIDDSVNNEYKRTILSGDELLITLVGNPGDCVVVSHNHKGLNVARAIASAKLKNPNIRHWIRYVFQSSPAKHLIEARLNTTVQKTLNLKDIKELPIPLPSDELRYKTVKILSSLEEKIIINEKINQTLEEMAQAIFKSWFVDFDPVKAKAQVIAQGGSEQDANLAAVQIISGKTRDQLAALEHTHPEQYTQLHTTASLFPSALVDSELVEIPEGWEAVNFGSCLSHTIGGDWGKDAPEGEFTEKVAIIRGTDLPDLEAATSNRVPIRYTTKKKLASRIVQNGDLILEVSGGSKDQPTGRSLYITNEITAEFDCAIAPASFCRLLRPNSQIIGSILACHLTYIYNMGKTWEYQNQSTGIANFQTTHFLENELVIIPNLELQEKFHHLIHSIYSKKHSNESKKLAELRDALLPKLLSGEIDVSQLNLDD